MSEFADSFRSNRFSALDGIILGARPELIEDKEESISERIATAFSDVSSDPKLKESFEGDLFEWLDWFRRKPRVFSRDHVALVLHQVLSVARQLNMSDLASMMAADAEDWGRWFASCCLAKKRREPFLEFCRLLKESGYSTFSVGDIKDLKAFTTRLLGKSDALSTWLWGRLDHSARAALVHQPASLVDEIRLQSLFVRNLNRVIMDGPVFEADRFQDIHLRLETKRLLDRTPGNANWVRLNRLLLEDAYPLVLSSGDWDRGQRPFWRSVILFKWHSNYDASALAVKAYASVVKQASKQEDRLDDLCVLCGNHAVILNEKFGTQASEGWLAVWAKAFCEADVKPNVLRMKNAPNDWLDRLPESHRIEREKPQGRVIITTTRPKSGVGSPTTENLSSQVG